MIEHSRYELREDDVDLDGGPTSKDLEEMLDRCVLEPDEAIAEEERAIFAEVVSPKTIRKQDSSDSWVEQTLQFFLCGSPRDEGCRVARGDDPEPPPPPPGSPGGPRTPGGGRPGSPPTAARVEARWAAEQIELLRQLRTDDGPDVAACAASLAARDGATWLVAGLDMSYFPDDDGAAVASLVVVELPSRRRVHAIHENVRVEGPYIPGFLAFREAPHYCRLLDRLRRDRPDVVPVACLVDGNGVLHPRGFGAASHVGVAASIPTVGVAKSLLAVDGLDERAVREGCAAAGLGFGGHTPLVGDSGRTWGAALRSSEPPPKRETTGQDAAFRPIFVSVGHGVCLRTAVALTTACCAYRVPEPIRLADLEGRDVVRTMCAV